MKRIRSEDGKTLNDLLQSDAIILNIPVNQRRYSWEQEQIEEYFNDFMRLVDNNCNDKHYLGVFSLIESQSNDIDFNILEVIDGQQRIITNLILISVIRDLYIALDNKQKAEKMQETYLSAQSPTKIVNKLNPSKMDKETVNQMININKGNGLKVVLRECENELNLDTGRDFTNINGLNERMTDAYNYFYKFLANKIKGLDSNKDRETFLSELERAFRKLDIILIKSEELESIFLFFDSLNNRGLQLTRLDIIKNNLFKVISRLDKKYEEDIELLWNKLVLTLEGYDENKFLKYYFMCIEDNKIIAAKDLAKEYEQHFNKFNEISNLEKEIKKINEYAEIFTRLFNKDDIKSQDGELDRRIKLINKLRQQACYSFYMDYMYFVKDESRQLKMIDALEKMVFRRVICKESVKVLDEIFKGIIEIRNISESGICEYDDEQILKIINKYSRLDDEFKETFKSRKWSPDEKTNYVLRKLEYNEYNYNQAIDIIINDRKKVHIEHILPNTYNEEWSKQLGIDKNKYENLKSKIGNLILLDGSINSSIKNQGYEQKKISYKNSKLIQVNKLITKYDVWNAATIEERTGDILNSIINILN